MSKIYIDEFIRFKEFPIRNGDVFQTILNDRKDYIDSKRFFLEYLSQQFVDRYDFNNPESLESFRNVCIGFDSPLKSMGGCNLSETAVQKGMRYSGIKVSDPTGNILGTFNIVDEKIMYSSIFPYFYEERDLIKFANDTYFTTMTFEEIMKRQIDLAREFYIHTRNPKTMREVQEHGSYIFERIDKDKMLECVTKPEIGQKILKKHLGIK